MGQGIQLSLLIGPGVPVAVPATVIDALQTLRVTSGTDGPSGFQLTFSLPTSSPLHTLFLVSSASPIPMVRVIIVVTVRGTAHVLMDGVMTNHEVSGSGAGATLTVTGEDLSRVMDYIDFSGLPYPAMPIAARVAVIVAKYAFLGIVPLVLPTPLVDLPNPIDRIPRQDGKDLAYLRRMADEVGYVFYVEPGPAVGTSTAYFGPEIKLGAPQSALNVDMDAATNVDRIDFSYDTEKATLPYVLIHNPITKVPIPIPVPGISPLNPALGVIPPIPKKVEPVPETAKYGPVRAGLIAMARAARTSEALTATGSLDVLRYGRVLKSRALVGVRGVGPAFDGLYYVRSVTHVIQRGQYRQDFTLSRNGLVSTVPRVPA